MKRRTFRTVRPYDQDITYMLLIEYDIPDDGSEPTMRVLTEDGWSEPQLNASVLGPHIPHITGLDEHIQGQAEAKMTAFQVKVQNLLDGAGLPIGVFDVP